MSRIWLVGAALWAGVSLQATTMFVPGDLLWATQADGRIYEIQTDINGQSFSSTAPIASTNKRQAGQLAFSADGQTAYSTNYLDDTISQMDNTGQVSTFATGINSPTGLIRTSDGRLLVADWSGGAIYDITAGGDFTSAIPYATGLLGPRNMVETPQGVLIADERASKVINIGSGGDLSAVAPMTYNIPGPAALAWFSGHLYIASGSEFKVYDAGLGGDMNGKASFAEGRSFASLAAANGRLYAGTGEAAGLTGIWDITSGGNFINETPLAYNLPGVGDSLLSAVPDPNAIPASIPEPSTAVVGLALLTGAINLLRRSSLTRD